MTKHDAEREAFEKWVKSGGSKYTCERYSEHCYAENTVNISWNAWQAARAQQPALSEDEVAKAIDDAIEKDDDDGNPHSETYGEIAYRVLRDAGAIGSAQVQYTNRIEPIAPKVTREELLEVIRDGMGGDDYTGKGEGVMQHIIAKWPHLVGE